MPTGQDANPTAKRERNLAALEPLLTGFGTKMQTPLTAALTAP